MKKNRIVYIVGGNYAANGMSKVLSQKINYLAENPEYELHMVLTERPDLPFHYPISDKVEYINFNINFDELDTLPIPQKVIAYQKKVKKYKTLLTEYLMKTKPDITVSTLRREINFINQIKDGSKKIGEIHFNKSNYREFSKSFLPKWINKVITHWWQKKLIEEIKKLDRFIVLTKEDQEKWKELNNVKVIHNPLSFIPKEFSACNSQKIIAAGRYTWQKGFDLLIEAWSIVHEQHKDWHLNIYGNGEHEVFQKIADDKGLSHSVICHPACADIYSKYQDSSIFVLSSRYEGFGLVIAEAMSCGIPVVAFACPCGPKDIITDNENGLLVENGNIQQLAQKICFLIEHKEIRKQMGRKARESSFKFTQEIIMKQWTELFNSIIKTTI